MILDNSSSMSSAGTSFDEIKQSLFEALSVLPGSYESGLRVFSSGGSRLVSPYNSNLAPLQSALSSIAPSEGTYIGQSLLDAAQDLLQAPNGNNRLILVTDGEGDQSDIQAAQEVKNRLSSLQGGFKCHFILFSNRADVWNETPIGQVANTLGCKVVAHDVKKMKFELTPSLLRIFGFDFYWIWIILSALAYIAMVFLTAYLIFDTQIAQGVRAKVAKTVGTGFVFGLLPAVMGAHLIGLFSGISGIIFGITLLSLGFVAIAMIGIGKGRKRSKFDDDGSDPFK